MPDILPVRPTRKPRTVASSRRIVFKVRAFLLAVATLAAACSSHTDSSSRNTLRAIGTLATVGGSPTILGYTVSIDGHNIYPSSTFTAAVSRDEFLADIQGSHGHHTLTIQLDRQTQLQADYLVSDVRVILSDTFFPTLHEIGRVSFPAQSATLAAGQSFVFPFDI